MNPVDRGSASFAERAWQASRRVVVLSERLEVLAATPPDPQVDYDSICPRGDELVVSNDAANEVHVFHLPHLHVRS
eukprot:7378230-Prymnesium_polylepis.1